MTTTWTAHSGLDYSVVMRGDETTDGASISTHGPEREALAVRVAALLNAAERIRDVVEAYIAPADEEQRGTYPNGAPMFAADGTMLDDQGNRSIFDDVDAGSDPCTSPLGHRWVVRDVDRGDGRSYCENCGADGDG